MVQDVTGSTTRPRRDTQRGLIRVTSAIHLEVKLEHVKILLKRTDHMDRDRPKMWNALRVFVASLMLSTLLSTVAILMFSAVLGAEIVDLITSWAMLAIFVGFFVASLPVSLRFLK